MKCNIKKFSMMGWLLTVKYDYFNYFLVFSESWSGSSFLLLFFDELSDSCGIQEAVELVGSSGVTLGILVSSNVPDFVSLLLKIQKKSTNLVKAEFKVEDLSTKISISLINMYLVLVATEGMGVAIGSNPSVSWRLGNLAAGILVTCLCSMFLSRNGPENWILLCCCRVGQSRSCSVGNASKSFWNDIMKSLGWEIF